jgi:hypothetical protein
MRPTYHLIATALLLPLATFAQDAAPAKKEAAPERTFKDPFVLKTEAPPQPDPGRLVLNLPNREFIQDFEQRQTAAIAGGATAATGVNRGAVVGPAKAPSAPSMVDASGGVSLVQPNLPTSAQGATPQVASGSAPASASSGPVPPPPLPQTMAQAAQQQSAASEPASVPTVAPAPEQVPAVSDVEADKTQSDLKSRALVFLVAQKKNLMFAGIAVVGLIALLTMRKKRRAESDEATE